MCWICFTQSHTLSYTFSHILHTLWSILVNIGPNSICKVSKSMYSNWDTHCQYFHTLSQHNSFTHLHTSFTHFGLFWTISVKIQHVGCLKACKQTRKLIGDTFIYYFRYSHTFLSGYLHGQIWEIGCLHKQSHTFTHFGLFWSILDQIQYIGCYKHVLKLEHPVVILSQISHTLSHILFTYFCLFCTIFG